MLDRLLPVTSNDAYRGHKLALWLFGAIVVMKLGIGLGTMFNGSQVAMEADGIPLDTFGADGAQAFVALFAAWGLAQFTLNLLGLVVLLRYRALVPLTFALLLFENAARKTLFLFLPIPRTGEAPGLLINIVLISVMAVGLVLSLWRRDGAG